MLLLLPTSSNNLFAKWKSLYIVVRKMGPVTYEIHHPDKKKSHQIYHVNLLKEWNEKARVESMGTSLMVRHVEEEGSTPEMIPQRGPAGVIVDHLDKPHHEKLQELLKRFPSLFQSRPGRTKLVHHTIHLTEATPSRQRPYRIPERLLIPLEGLHRLPQVKRPVKM